jgi:predicted  nucleic acid-binding Zn-ribbon protein
VPKKDVRAIDDQVKKLDTHVKSLEQEFWTKNDPEKKARSESMTGQLTAAIEELESKIQSASGSEKADLESELATKKAWLAVLN